MLRSAGTRTAATVGLALAALVGVAAATLVLLGNPGNMGICGACFLRDWAGALGLFATGPQVFRPEVVGVLGGALAYRALRRQFAARSGSHAVTRFACGVVMAFAALVFLGCPFRMLQRVGGGDLNALVGLVGFLGGVRVGMAFEHRGYSVGKTQVVAPAVGLLGPLFAVLVFVLFLLGGHLRGPGPGDPGGPPHAPWLVARALALGAGAALSATGFCAVLAARQVFRQDRRMLAGAGLLVLGYAAVFASAGRLQVSFAGQPAAHQDLVWNVLAPALLGLTGVLAGGCPVRQIVMAGQGNGDAFLTVVGLLVGGALAHNLGLVSSAAGTTPAGRIAVVVGLLGALAYAASIVRARRAAGGDG